MERQIEILKYSQVIIQNHGEKKDNMLAIKTARNCKSSTCNNTKCKGRPSRQYLLI